LEFRQERAQFRIAFQNLHAQASQPALFQALVEGRRIVADEFDVVHETSPRLRAFWHGPRRCAKINCARASGVAMTEDERAIRALIATWIAASKAGDLETVLGLMAEDVVFMVPSRAFGRGEFVAAFQGMKGMDFEARSEVLEIEVLGNTAWCRTHLSVTMAPPNAKPVKRAGHTLSILRKNADGAWVIARDANMLAAE
jgi:uncharacterized protein (TIGR02246 family)